MSIFIEFALLLVVVIIAIWGICDGFRRCKCSDEGEELLLHECVDIDSGASHIEIFVDTEGYVYVKQIAISKGRELRYELREDLYDMRFNVCPKCGRLTDRDDLDYEEDAYV